MRHLTILALVLTMVAGCSQGSPTGRDGKAQGGRATQKKGQPKGVQPRNEPPSTPGQKAYFDAISKLDYDKALQMLRKECLDGNGRSCHLAGRILKDSLGTKGNPKASWDYFEKGCSLGYGRACVAKADLLLAGRGVARDQDRARKIYEKHCDAGDGLACSNLGFMYGAGMGVKRNLAKARSLFSRACDMGSPDGCLNLALLYDRGFGVKKDPARALELYRKACKLGSGKGCRYAAVMYHEGRGTSMNLPEALMLYRKGCRLKDFQACNEFAGLLMTYGGPKQVSSALELLDHACAIGGGESCFLLGTLYQGGAKGVKPDLKKAIRYYDGACNLGIAPACVNGGLLYISEFKNEAKGVEFLMRACEKGAAMGCVKMAPRFEKGEGVPKDLAKALEYYAKGCAAGDKGSCVGQGRLLLDPANPKHDPKRGVEILDRVCKDGEGRACAQLFAYYSKGKARDGRKAAEYAELACRYGESSLCKKKP